MFKPDLHCHSHFSDGQHPPEFLVDRALSNGLTHLAVTDHDYITNMAESVDAKNLHLISGVEVSCAWRGREIHVVGLFIDPANDDLNELLSGQRRKRKTRIYAMDEKLQKNGISGLANYVSSLKCETWTRSHVAEFLVGRGHCKSWEKAFKKYLSQRGRIYVPIEWSPIEAVVQTIKLAGGIPVIAHPGRYGLTKTKTKQLVLDFKAVGGEAIEGSYGNVDPVTRKYLCELAQEESLYVSVGSDFHSASRHWTDLGKYPTIDSAIKNTIWVHPKWYF